MDKWKNGAVYLFCISLWFVLFCSGVIIGTQSHRAEIRAPDADTYRLMWCWFVILVNFTLTNIGMLCCLASVIGGLTHKQDRETVPKLLSHGLFVYLFFFTTMYVLDTVSLMNINQERYIRMALLLSFFSYVVGFNPELFDSIMRKSKDKVINDLINNQQNNSQSQTTATSGANQLLIAANKTHVQTQDGQPAMVDEKSAFLVLKTEEKIEDTVQTNEPAKSPETTDISRKPQ